MRKLIVQEWLSADGYAADEKGSTDFFGPSEDHVRSDKDIVTKLDAIDTILMGANTYRMFVEFWPTEKSENEIVSEPLNATNKIVFSNSLDSVEWGKWNNATLHKGDAVEAVKKLKQQNGKDLILWGSLSLFRPLLDAGLVDEISIGVVPVILGKGLRLFGESGQITLESMSVKTYDNGITQINYAVKK
ncbi:reductase [Mucilaginibacter hurinus]|uniref:Reductase n=1 Tax=Mucilaginibacter hurinus TaxID=2201324 RepID=A0A367GQG1_9SPHI|nr:dihydrofolate reductase family protein [Mucilaginibacter hurinus]RCH55689.1 reductase [Mucilaginibacter hurinus]